MFTQLTDATRENMAQALVDVINSGPGNPRIGFFYRNFPEDATLTNMAATDNYCYLQMPKPIEASVTDGVITLNDPTDSVWLVSPEDQLYLVNLFAIEDGNEDRILMGRVGDVGTSFAMSLVTPYISKDNMPELAGGQITIGNPNRE